MKSFKTILIIGTFALLLFASCDKGTIGQGGEDDNETISVKIELQYPDALPASKAVGEKLADKSAHWFDRGHLYFVGDDNIIYEHVTLGLNFGSRSVTKEELLSGSFVIEGLPPAIKKCYLILNDVAALTSEGEMLDRSLRGESFIETNRYQYRPPNLNSDGGGVELVPLYGEGILQFGDPNNPNHANLGIEVGAAATRYQIGKISAGSYSYKDKQDQNQTITINSFEVQGIYVNNFYSLLTLNRGPNFVRDFGSVRSMYSATSGQYAPNAYGERLHDQINRELIAPNLILYPDEADISKVWAYNLIPSEGFIPHLIIKLSNVRYTDSAGGGEQTLQTQFITVQNLKFGPGHPREGDSVTSFEENNIYTLNEVHFNYSHLTTVPYQETLSATVTVAIMSWDHNEVEWADD